MDHDADTLRDGDRDGGGGARDAGGSAAAWRSLPTAARTRWRVQGVLVAMLLFAAPGAGLTVLGWLLVDAVALVVPVVVLGAAVALGITWANRRYERFGYRLDEDRLRVRDGVVIHSDAVAPLFRVQHVDLTRGPLQLAFDLATLSIHTASPAADITLPDLRTADAEQLRDEILTSSKAAAASMGTGDVDAV